MTVKVNTFKQLKKYKNTIASVTEWDGRTLTTLLKAVGYLNSWKWIFPQIFSFLIDPVVSSLSILLAKWMFSKAYCSLVNSTKIVQFLILLWEQNVLTCHQHTLVLWRKEEKELHYIVTSIILEILFFCYNMHFL